VDGSLIVQAARKYLGTPFVHQGRAPGAGMDCIGLLVLTARDVSIPIEDHAGYTRRPDPVVFIEHLKKNLRRIPRASARIGDVLVFWIQKPSKPQHLAIKTDVGMIHTYAGAGKRAALNHVVESSLDRMWAHRLHSAWRFKGD